MRRLAIAALCAASMAAAPVAGGASAPTVSLAGIAPVSVVGSGFARSPAARVTVSWKGGRLTRLVRIGVSGRFAVKWQTSLSVHACRGTVVTVRAAAGQKASWTPGTKSCGAIAVPVAPVG